MNKYTDLEIKSVAVQQESVWPKIYKIEKVYKYIYLLVCLSTLICWLM